MRAVELGMPAEDSVPVIDGLTEGERVITVGAFLIDSENRLNPSSALPASAGDASTTQP